MLTRVIATAPSTTKRAAPRPAAGRTSWAKRMKTPPMASTRRSGSSRVGPAPGRVDDGRRGEEVGPARDPDDPVVGRGRDAVRQDGGRVQGGDRSDVERGAAGGAVGAVPRSARRAVAPARAQGRSREARCPARRRRRALPRARRSSRFSFSGSRAPATRNPASAGILARRPAGGRAAAADRCVGAPRRTAARSAGRGRRARVMRGRRGARRIRGGALRPAGFPCVRARVCYGRADAAPTVARAQETRESGGSAGAWTGERRRGGRRRVRARQADHRAPPAGRAPGRSPGSPRTSACPRRPSGPGPTASSSGASSRSSASPTRSSSASTSRR